MKITGNGTFPLQSGVSWSSTVIYCGAFGGATVTLYKDGVALSGGVLQENAQFTVTHGVKAGLDVVVTGYTADITLELYEG